MQPQMPPAAPPARTYSATLKESRRITPPESREEVRHLVFRTYDLSFDPALGNLVRVMAPGQFGNRSHARLYSIMDLERRGNATEFAICVRRCSYIDDFNGEEYKGVASNYLCDLRPERPAGVRRPGRLSLCHSRGQDRRHPDAGHGHRHRAVPRPDPPDLRKDRRLAGHRCGCSTAPAARWKCST